MESEIGVRSLHPDVRVYRVPDVLVRRPDSSDHEDLESISFQDVESGMTGVAGSKAGLPTLGPMLPGQRAPPSDRGWSSAPVRLTRLSIQPMPLDSPAPAPAPPPLLPLQSHSPLAPRLAMQQEERLLPSPPLVLPPTPSLIQVASPIIVSKRREPRRLPPATVAQPVFLVVASSTPAAAAAAAAVVEDAWYEKPVRLLSSASGSMRSAVQQEVRSFSMEHALVYLICTIAVVLVLIGLVYAILRLSRKVRERRGKSLLRPSMPVFPNLGPYIQQRRLPPPPPPQRLPPLAPHAHPSLQAIPLSTSLRSPDPSIPAAVLLPMPPQQPSPPVTPAPAASDPVVLVEGTVVPALPQEPLVKQLEKEATSAAEAVVAALTAAPEEPLIPDQGPLLRSKLYLPVIGGKGVEGVDCLPLVAPGETREEQATPAAAVKPENQVHVVQGQVILPPVTVVVPATAPQSPKQPLEPTLVQIAHAQPPHSQHHSKHRHKRQQHESQQPTPATQTAPEAPVAVAVVQGNQVLEMASEGSPEAGGKDADSPILSIVAQRFPDHVSSGVDQLSERQVQRILHPNPAAASAAEDDGQQHQRPKGQ